MITSKIQFKFALLLFAALFCFSTNANLASASSDLINVEIKCGKSKSGASGHRDRFDGVASSKSVVLNFEYPRNEGGMGIKQLIGYIIKDKLIIKGEGVILKTGEKWKYFFSAASSGDIISTLEKGLDGKENPGSNKSERKCRISLVSAVSTSKANYAIQNNKNAKGTISVLREKLDKSELRLNDLLEQANSDDVQIEKLISDITSLNSKLNDAEKKAELALNAAKNTNSISTELAKVRANFTETTNELQTEITRLENVESELQRSLATKEKLVSELESQVSQLEAETKENNGQINNDDIIKFARTIANLEDELLVATNKVNDLSTENSNSLERIKSLETELALSTSELADIKSNTQQSSVCDNTETQKSDNSGVIDYLEKKIKELENQSDNCFVEPGNKVKEPEQKDQKQDETNSSSVASGNEGSTQNVKTDLPVPTQRFFLDLVYTTSASYSKSDTSAKKKLAWIKANKKLCSDQIFDVSSEKNEWVGFVDEVYMRDNGDVRLELSIDDAGNEVVQTVPLDTLLRLGIEEEIIEFEEGDRIQFSGTFNLGNMKENECLSAGLMSNPELLDEEFRFEFTKIQKMGGGECKAFASCFNYTPLEDTSSAKTNGIVSKSSEGNLVANSTTVSPQGPTAASVKRYPFLAGSDDDRMKRLIGFGMGTGTNAGSVEGIKEMFVMMCTYDSINPNLLTNQRYKDLHTKFIYLKTERPQLMEVFEALGLDKEFEYCNSK